jgi:hypothetical protein
MFFEKGLTFFSIKPRLFSVLSAQLLGNFALLFRQKPAKTLGFLIFHTKNRVF